ncbi:uncharacterized protein I206_103936 [Kwoniella pini CBS 10737]|uniref:DUF7719 domain-containing protein n=1 Tax=Kwoniella pini CBS 10737 TaxID=1296096 RepID=A0AAJ8L6H0_9TREE
MAIVEELPSTSNQDMNEQSTTRQRKNKNKSKNQNKKKTSFIEEEEEIPLKRPSQFILEESPNQNQNQNQNQKEKQKPLIDIKLPKNSNLLTINPGELIDENIINNHIEEEEEKNDEIFKTLIIVIPFTFLFLLLNILVHLQFNHRPKLSELFKSCLTALPTNRYSNHWLNNSFLMFSSIFSGCRLIWLVNKASWSIVTAQAPPMGTMWILTIVQLPLSRAVLALLIVGIWIWWQGMKLMP